MLQSKLRWILSVFIIYFVSMLLIMSNGASYLGRSLQRFYLPVANSLGLNTTWNFFSPDPAHVLFLRYIIVFQDKEGNETQPTIEAFYPAHKDQGDFSIFKRREAYLSRFIAIDPTRLSDLFAPWLCRQHPGATRIRAELFLRSIPVLDKAQMLNAEDIGEMVDPTLLNGVSYDCP